MFKKVILSVLFIAASFIISCTEERFENFGNAIKGLIPEECDECFIAYIYGGEDWLENYEFGILTDGDYLTGESKYWSVFRMSYSQPGDEFYARIDWYREPLSTPGVGMRYAIINEVIYNQIKQENILYITDAKMTPGVVYEWDFSINELIATEERTSKIESRPGAPQGGNDGGGCGSLVKTWTLKSINGNPLPYKQYDDGANSLTWTSGTMTFTSSDTWSSRLVSRQVANGSTNDVNTDRSGTYTCSGGSGSLSNASGNAGTFSVSGGVLTVIDGSFVLTYK